MSPNRYQPLLFILHTSSPIHHVWIIACCICSLKIHVRINDDGRSTRASSFKLQASSIIHSRSLEQTLVVAILLSRYLILTMPSLLFAILISTIPPPSGSETSRYLKETHTARRNRIQPRLMEVPRALKLSSRDGSLDLTGHLSSGFYPLEEHDLEVCETLEVICGSERTSPA